MADIAIFRINYKSDFILTLNSDAGWMTPFCIKFWTGAPSQAYFAGYDGTTYTHCAPVEGDPTKLVVQFDDHHLPVGDLTFQIGYHFTVADFPTSVEDEVLNQASVIIEQDGEPAQVMLDFNGETAPEIEFSLPAYANEAQRITNEQARIEAEQQRIANEDARIQAEETRQQNEQQRIAHETNRINEFATLKSQSQAATSAANAAATLANEKAQLAADKAALAQAAATLANDKAQLAADKAALAQAAATLANDKAALAQQKAAYAQTQGDYAKAQGDYAKAQGDTAQADHERAEADHATAASDHSRAESDHTTAASDHSRAETDHTTAASDHSRAETDHTTAASDHSRAESDHTTAAADHSRAESDHTTAAADHETAASDHTRAESDHAAVEVYVDSLGAFDISSYHATGGVLAKYADLSAALGTDGANIPEGIRKGGMSVKFVQSSDNKYVQCRLMHPLDNPSTAAADFANTANWQGVDSEPTAGSKNLVESGGVAKKLEQIDNNVFGERSLNHFSVNKYYDTTGQLKTANGWGASDIFQISRDWVLKFDENVHNYYMRRIVVYNDSSYLGTLYPSGVKQLSYPCNDIFEQYPLANKVGVCLSDGSTTTEVSESITADWNLYLVNDNAMAQKLKELAESTQSSFTEVGSEIEGLSRQLQSDVNLLSGNITNLDERVSEVESVLTTKSVSFDFVLNELITNSNSTVQADGWAHSDKKEILNGSTFTFAQNDLGYYIYYALLYDEDNTFLGYRAMSQETSLYSITAERLRELFPTSKYVIFDFYGGSSHAALTTDDISDWSMTMIVSSEIEGMQEEIEDLQTDVENIQDEIEDIQAEIGTRLNVFHCDLNLDALSYIISPFNSTYDIKTVFKIKRTAEVLDVNPTFNFIGVYLKNKSTGTETEYHSCPDDISPASYNNTYIGGNHGCDDLCIITASNHGKTAVDVGSVWSNGTTECTLVGVPDGNTLWFIGANTLQYPLFTFNTAMFTKGVTLSHVSGATNTSSISIDNDNGAVVNAQWRSALTGNVSVYMDDVEVTQSGDYSFNKLKICEQYDVLNPASVVEKMRLAVGTLSATPNPNSFDTADKVVRHSIVYEFDSASEWRIATDFVAYQDITLSYFGFTQQMPLTGQLKMYIPKVLPINDVDFRTIANYSSVPNAMTIDSDSWENVNLPPDRWLQFSQYLGLHSGYLFDYGVGGTHRKDYINRAFLLATSRKIYPYGINRKITVTAGDNFSVVVWRSYLDVSKINSNGIIATNIFEYNGNCYIYADFNAVGVYELDIPSRFVGKEINVFEKRDNVELLTSLSNSKILVKVTNGTPMYGYLVAKING